jgi:hypothetical protein
VALVELRRGVARHAAHPAAALDGGALAGLRRPAPRLLVAPHVEPFAAAVGVVLREPAGPRPDRDVGDPSLRLPSELPTVPGVARRGRTFPLKR